MYGWYYWYVVLAIDVYALNGLGGKRTYNIDLFLIVVLVLILVE